jgi:hypothetical protein
VEIKAPHDRLARGILGRFLIRALSEFVASDRNRRIRIGGSESDEGLGRFGFDDGSCGCGAGGEQLGLFAALEKLLFAKPVESCFVTDISRHCVPLSVKLICVRSGE